MKNLSKKLCMVIASLLSLAGWFMTVYVAGYWLMFRPFYFLITGIMAGTATQKLIVVCVLKIFLSTTVGGAVWIGFDLIAGIFRDLANGREE